jgi:hypothetical protein
LPFPFDVPPPPLPPLLLLLDVVGQAPVVVTVAPPLAPVVGVTVPHGT